MDRSGGEVPERLAIARLDAAAAEFSAASRHLEALECMEKALFVRTNIYGVKSPEVSVQCLQCALCCMYAPIFAHACALLTLLTRANRPSTLRLRASPHQVWTAAKEAGELCNLLALSFLQKEDYAVATALLKKAEVLTEKDPHGRAITHNNWACLMRQQGKLRVALSHLKHALAIEERMTKANNPADTHLNLCAVLSQLHRHPEALTHAQTALDLIQADVYGTSINAGAKAAMQALKKAKSDRIAVLCIAYHNLGVENEFAKKFTDALKAYTKGTELANALLGETHGVTLALKESQLAAAKTIKQEAEKARKEKEAREAAAAAAVGKPP